MSPVLERAIPYITIPAAEVGLFQAYDRDYETIMTPFFMSSLDRCTKFGPLNYFACIFLTFYALK